MSSVHVLRSLVRFVTSLRESGFLELCVICEKLMVYRVVSYDIGERCSVLDEENGPQYRTLRHTIHELCW